MKYFSVYFDFLFDLDGDYVTVALSEIFPWFDLAEEIDLSSFLFELDKIF